MYAVPGSVTVLSLHGQHNAVSLGTTVRHTEVKDSFKVTQLMGCNMDVEPRSHYPFLLPVPSAESITTLKKPLAKEKSRSGLHC